MNSSSLLWFPANLLCSLIGRRDTSKLHRLRSVLHRGQWVKMGLQSGYLSFLSSGCSYPVTSDIFLCLKTCSWRTNTCSAELWLFIVNILLIDIVVSVPHFISGVKQQLAHSRCSTNVYWKINKWKREIELKFKICYGFFLRL